MLDFSKRALMEFIDASIGKGRIDSNTGGGMRSACKKILEQVGPDEDLRNFDVQAAVVQYNNRHPTELSAASLRVYESRVRAALDWFVKSITDPLNSTPPGRPGSPKVVKSDTKKPERRESAGTSTVGSDLDQPQPHPPPIARGATETSLALPFPLRPTFLAQIVIPRDLTKDEARRLSLFIESLSHDPPPSRQ